MKKKLLILVVLISSFIYSQEDYKIKINGKVIDAELDKNYEITVNNEVFEIQVSLKDSLTYNDNFLSFKYPKEYKISSTIIDQGIEQLMLMTAEGSGFVIQKYSTMNPSMLNELMINEVTKESISYGFEMKREEYQRTLKSGMKLNVIRAVLTYKDEVNIYELTSKGNKDEGVLIMTMEMSDEDDTLGKQLHNMIWGSLVLY